MSKLAIHWFRRDLRLADNPSLHYAAQNGPVTPIFILDTVNNTQKEFNLGEASSWWLHHSLNSLNESLGDRINCFSGDPLKIIEQLISAYEIESFSWNRCYSPWEIERDTKIKSLLKDNDIEVKTFNASLLWEPWEILKDDNTPYKVFSPFYRKGCLKKHAGPREVVAKNDYSFSDKLASSSDIDSLNLLPKHHWKDKLNKHWKIGEESAMEKYIHFRDNGLTGYKEGENFHII